MARYVLKRILLFFPTLLGITLITFLLMQALPGDPVQGMAGERANPETLARIRSQIGQDRPLVLRYGGYLGLLCRGELGRSLYTGRSVAADLGQKFPNTLKLACAAILFATLGGMLIGVSSAVKRGTWLDSLASVVTIGGVSIPVFWLGLALMLLFSLHFRWLPPSGMSGNDPAYFILPAITLGTFSLAVVGRVTRASMIETLSQPYIAAARAKGLPERTIVLRHALRNALIPVITVIGLDLGSYLNGAVLTETIFGWDGLGRFALDGILKRDYPVIMGVVLFGSVAFVFVNLLVDVAYHFIDPRIRVRRKGQA